MSRLPLRLSKVTPFLFDRVAIKAFCTWKPFSATALNLVRSLTDYGCNPITVIDAGANVGQFSRAILQTFRGSHVYGFEPLLGAYNKLIENFREDPRARFTRCALGSEPGSAVLNVNSFSQSSSLMPLSENHKDAFPTAEEVGQESIEVARLDDMVDAASLDKPILLKIDVQGFELQVLEGANATLAHVDYVLVEVGLVPLYVGEPSFRAVMNFLENAGLTFIAPISTLRDEKKKITIQMDALFARRH